MVLINDGVVDLLDLKLKVNQSGVEAFPCSL